MLLEYVRRPNFLFRPSNQMSECLLGQHKKPKGTTTVEGNERLSVGTRVPHAAVPSLSGSSEAGLDARDCGRRAVVCICTEASELPDRRREEFVLLLLTVED